MDDIEILENKIQCFRYMQNTLNDDEKELFEDGIQQEEIQAIENLIKENKELKEHLQKYYNGELFTAKQLKKLEENQRKYFIHKSKIREIIREYSVPRGKNERFMPYDNVLPFLNKLEELLNKD